MAKQKKWEIKEIKKGGRVSNAAKLIIGTRLSHLLETIEKYFDKMDVDNLHNVRISLRRVRYNMELFISCFNRKQFLGVYNAVQELQDLSGAVRDLDVFKENINALVQIEKARVNKTVLQKVEKKRKKLEEELKLALMKFVHSKKLKNFYKLVL
ncbi:MAG: CHAD domain-containing protein [Ignavibacteriaceae bacterium]|nr:CHAD domain-containing protein [Ignavibacteriaceae bacterium]